MHDKLPKILITCSLGFHTEGQKLTVRKSLSLRHLLSKVNINVYSYKCTCLIQILWTGFSYTTLQRVIALSVSVPLKRNLLAAHNFLRLKDASKDTFYFEGCEN